MSYALGSVIERVVDAVKRRIKELYARGREAASKYGSAVREAPKSLVSDESFAKSFLTAIVKLHVFLSREDAVVVEFRKIGSSVQKLQSSLEDSLSALSLLLEFLFALSIVLILVIARWS